MREYRGRILRVPERTASQFEFHHEVDWSISFIFFPYISTLFYVKRRAVFRRKQKRNGLNWKKKW